MRLAVLAGFLGASAGLVVFGAAGAYVVLRLLRSPQGLEPSPLTPLIGYGIAFVGGVIGAALGAVWGWRIGREPPP